MLQYRCIKRFYCAPLERYIPIGAVLKIYEEREGYELENSPWSLKESSHIRVENWSFDDNAILHSWFNSYMADNYFIFEGQFPDCYGSYENFINDTVIETDSTWSSNKINEELIDLSDDIEDLSIDLSGKQDISEKGVVNGYASLDSGGKVPWNQLPSELIPISIQLNFTDYSTQRVVVGDKTKDRVVISDYTLETTDNSYYQGGRLKIVHNGSGVAFDNEIWGIPKMIPKMIYGSDLNSNDMRMVFTANGVGTNLKLKYLVVRKIPVTI